MKIGYLTKQDPKDKKAYSGIHFYMYKALQQQFENVITLGPVDTPYKYIPKATGKFRNLISGKIYKYQYNVALCKRMSAIIDQRIAQSHPDAVLASLMTPEVAWLKTRKPIFLTADATFPRLHKLYASHSNLHPKSVNEAKQLEARAFSKAKKLIFPLDWLADSAMNDYGVSSGKIEVVPYGANHSVNITQQDVDDWVNQRYRSKSLKLLFVGVRWEEKGGPFVVDVLLELLQCGVDAELWIAGCKPAIQKKAEPGAIQIKGFLDKQSEEEMNELYRLYREASFFIMPTNAECVGMSFVEAASFGLPAIGKHTGGVPEAVLHNHSGFIIEDHHTPRDVAEWIYRGIENRERYISLSKNAFRRYQQKMNWQSWAEQVHRIIEEAS